MTETSMLREIIADKQAEIDELKRLLRLAMDDLDWVQVCSTCKDYENDGDPHCAKGCWYRWRHADEAEKMLNRGESHD